MLPRLRPSSTLITICGLALCNAGLMVVGVLACRVDPSGTPSAQADRGAYRFPALEMKGRGDSRDAASDPILLRPLFFASRSPFVLPPLAPKAAAIVQALPDPQWFVDGLVLATGFQAAHLGNSSDPTGKWYHIGQSINGWILLEVSESAVLLRQGDRTQSLRLYKTASGVGHQPTDASDDRPRQIKE